MRYSRMSGALILLLSFAALSYAQKPYRGAEYRTIPAMTYGRFEARMKSAPVSGMLGSFFTYYDAASPWNEIDLETLGRYNNETQFNTIVPTQADNHVQRQPLHFNPHAAFHVYALEWTPEYVAWRVDGYEVYRQTGTHIALLNRPQKIMMNIWQPASTDWAGYFSPASLPVYVYYDWVRYSSYTPGINDNFTPQWTDDFDAFDATRWQKATHTWDGNNAQFVQENAVLQGGYLILCLTSNTTSGYAGGAVTDADVDPPYVAFAGLYDSTVVMKFSEPLDSVSAENPSAYGGGGFTSRSPKLLPDRQTVELAVTGSMPTASFPLIVQSVKDRSVPAHAMPAQIVYVPAPIRFPLFLNVGGPASGVYLADSVWNSTRNYGGTGGILSTLPSTTTIGGTADQEIYRTSLHGISNYSIRVPNGVYAVTLMMVEDRYASAGKRKFSAKVEGQPLFSDLDIYARVGSNTAYSVTAPGVQVTDNTIDLWFGSTVDSTTLSGVVVQRMSGPAGVLAPDPVPPPVGFSVYPNPFNPSLVLRYELPSSQPVTVSVHDILGRRVALIDLGTPRAGTHSYRWSPVGLPSGVYFCTLQGSRTSITRRVLLVK